MRSPRSSFAGTTLEALERRQLFAATIRIMPLGDSITESFAPHESYRYWLWNSLQNAGYHNIDFVGSQHGVKDGSPADPNFDQDHEGHSGWTADQIAAEVTGWAQTYQPDVVLLHAGTNDLRASQSIESTINDLGTIIDDLRAANPKVTILLSKVIPDQNESAQIAQLDEQIPTLITSKASATSKLMLVDPATSISISTDLFDGLHPNELGEKKIAGKFFDALTQVLPNPNQAPPSNTTYISRLSTISSSNGEGPVELDESNGGDGQNDGSTMSIGGTTFNHGLGVSANSRIDYRLNGRQKYFAADIGVDDETGGAGSVVFKIYADGKRIFCSNVMTGQSGSRAIKFNIRGVHRLTLIVTDAADGQDRDHADWGNARLMV